MDNSNLSTEGGGPSVTTESDDSGEGEDEPSSHLHSELEQFRTQWQKELNSSRAETFVATADGNSTDGEVASVRQAKQLFLQGVCAEQNGCLYEAVHFYKRAIQLVPDIEFQVSSDASSKSNQNSEDDFDVEQDRSNKPALKAKDAGTVEDDELHDLTARFLKLVLKTNQICFPEYEQKMSHISLLPREIILYIFKWVVSSDLDFRTLEQLSMVCRGFYLCARDPEIWRLACYKVWGVNTGSANKYGSWRNMFVERPRLRYNGAYISKTTYIRHGENSFQDQFYRPWHLVEYYRYLRFFPDGVVLMLTTPDDPNASLSKLRHRHPKHTAVLVGRYRLHCCSVVAMLKRMKLPEPMNHYQRYKCHRQNQIYDPGEQTFHIELEIKSHKKKPNYQLIWTHYAIHNVHRNCTETNVSEFELQQNNFPPFWFSRVKSYTSESESPLQ